MGTLSELVLGAWIDCAAIADALGLSHHQAVGGLRSSIRRRLATTPRSLHFIFDGNSIVRPATWKRPRP
jgi:hypothetical protein